MPFPGRSAALLLLLVSGGCVQRTPPEPYTIGQLIPLSGPDKVRGEHARNGAALALEAGARGGPHGSGRPVEVRHVDSRDSSEAVRAGAVRLVTLNRAVALLGGCDPNLAEALARAAQSYGVPVLLPADLPALPVGESVFCLNVAPDKRGEALARFAARDRKWRRVAALTDPRTAAGAALAAAFAIAWRREHSGDKEAFAGEWSRRDDSDWPELTRRALAAKPDAVLLAAEPHEFLRLRAKLAEAGLKVPLLYGGPDRGAGPLADDRGPGPDVVLATAFTAAADLGAEGAAFVRTYEEKFRERPDLPAAMAYDGVRLLADALGRANSAEPERLRQELLAVNDFPSVTGPLSLADRRAKRRLFVVELKGGETKVVRAFGPGLE
jgi:branched-chain amino acid transport system substrate-binding protein